MGLSSDQQQVIATLRREAAQTRAYILDKSGGLTGYFSGDSGDAERYAVDTESKRIDVLEAHGDDNRLQSWAAQAEEISQSLAYLRNLRAGTTFKAILQDTAKATGEDVKDGINAAAAVAGTFALAAIPGWVYLVGIGLVVLKLGLLKRGKA